MTPPVPGPFELPPDISFRKELLGGAQAYVFRHARLGDLGRIVLRGRPDGRTDLSLELAGDPRDPATEERAAIFEPLGLEITAAFEAAIGSGAPRPTAHRPPQPTPPPTRIASQRVECERCGAAVALLVFADDATDPGGLEDAARLMYPHIASLDVPTWIVGPPLVDEFLEDAPSDLLKVWPEREPPRAMTPAALDAVLDALVGAHCP